MKTAQDVVSRLNKKLPKAIEQEDVDLPRLLRKPRYKDAPFAALKQIHSVLDKFSVCFSGVVCCKKGCSYCCHSEIALSKLEAAYIEKVTGLPATPPVKPLFGSKAEPYTDPARPCPFLDQDGGCSIYEARPVMCRTHFSLEPETTPCHFDSGVTEIYYMDRSTSFPGTMTAFFALVAAYSPTDNGGFADIRQFFPKVERPKK